MLNVPRSRNLALHGKSTETRQPVVVFKRMVSSRTPCPPTFRLSRRTSPTSGCYYHHCSLLHRNYTVFGLAVDLGTIQSTSSPVTWSIGYVRDPAITYTTATGALQQRRPYYVTQYANISDVVSTCRLLCFHCQPPFASLLKPAHMSD